MEQVIKYRSNLSKYYFIIGILIICLYMAPYMILRQDSKLRIHDTLDVGISNLVAVARSGNIFKLDGVVNSIMNGLPRSSFVSPFYIVQWLFFLFRPFTAFVINAFIVHLIAFIGMFLLLKKHFIRSEEKIWIVFGCSLSFALLPHMPLLGLSVTGQPLLLYAFLNLRNKEKRFVNYAIIVIFAFYSYLVLSGVFIVCALGILSVVDYLKNKQVNRHFLLGFFVLIAGYGIMEYSLISDIFFKKFISNRTEWNIFWPAYSFKEAVKIAFSDFIHFQTHAYSLHTPILASYSIAMITLFFNRDFLRKYKTILLMALLAAFILSFLICFYIGNGSIPSTPIREIDVALQSLPLFSSLLDILHKYVYFILLLISIPLIVFSIVLFFLTKKNSSPAQDSRLLYLLSIIVFSISLFYGFYTWIGLIPIREKMALLKTFQADRFYFLHPLLWYIIFALSLVIIYKTKPGKYIALFFLVFQAYYLLINNNENYNQWRYNVKAAYYKIVGKSFEPNALTLTYKNYFSENLYKEIKDYISVPQKDYRVVSIGLYPNIATYNGFYTLDAYVAIYPLEYKHKFRKIIENELNKSKYWQKYFDYWGSRCYVFVAELENLWFENKKDDSRKINNLDINTGQLKEMGGAYIFSAFEIVNAEQNKLSFLRVFERNDSPWRIYLYKIK